MRVLAAVVVAPHMAVSGAVTAATEHSAEIARHCAIDLVRMADREGLDLGGPIPVRLTAARLPFGPLLEQAPNKVRTPLYRSRIPDMVRRGDYDLVHLHNPMPTLEMRRIARAALDAGVPYVVSAHGFVELGSGGHAYGLSAAARLAWRWLVEEPLAFVVRHAAAILVSSGADAAVVRALGYPEERIHLVPNGVRPPSRPRLTVEERRQVAARFGFGPAFDRGAPVCLFVANHTPNKGLPTLLEAFEASDRPYTLVVGGSKRGFVDYGRHRGDPARGQTILFTDLLERGDLDDLFGMADLFVFPTRADTFPLVILEAMAHGLPILSTRVGGIPWQVDDAVGTLVAPDDPAALKAAFEELASDRDRLSAMGEAAARRARERFSWPKAGRDAADLYRSVLAEAASTQAAPAQPA